jgi:hypothetical protein
MWNYKTFYYLILVYLISSIFIGILSASGIRIINPWLNGFANYGIIVMHMGITYSIISTLKWHKEGRWRLFAMYVLLAEEIVMTVISFLLKNSGQRTLVNFYASVMILDVFFCLYVFISSLLIKNRQIMRYFKLYGICLIVGVVGLVVFQFVFAYYHLPENLYSPTCAILFKLHTIPLLMMYINLYNKISRFRVGDSVVIKKDMENISAGTRGVVISKHVESGYYEVEFADENGHLLEVLTISSKDIEHIAEPDLQTRVEAFGK